MLDLNKGRADQGLQLVYSYLDDLILAGEQRAVAGAFHFLKCAASEIVLEFNTSKCEVIPAAGHDATIIRDLFPNNMFFKDDGNYELLGRLIGTDDFCNEHTQKRVDKDTELLIVYSLCVVPHHKHRRALRNFDNSVCDCIE